jgi:DNA-binding response OmpR family regulator
MFEILVIDDDPNIHTMLKLAFEDIGMHGTFVTTGEKGIERIRKYFSDIIMLDIHLPGKSGIQVLKQIRSDPTLRNMTVVMLTIDRDRETLVECARLGITDYIAKPFDISRLIAKLSMIARNLTIEREHAKTLGISQIKIDRKPGTVLLTFVGAISEKTLDQFRNLYTTAFAAMTKTDTYILNLRVLPDLDTKQLGLINQMSALLRPQKPLFIGGRNYGAMLNILPDFETQLFVIEEDAFEYLESQK